jgi:hypothetical protein
MAFRKKLLENSMWKMLATVQVSISCSLLLYDIHIQIHKIIIRGMTSQSKQSSSEEIVSWILRKECQVWTGFVWLRRG